MILELAGCHPSIREVTLGRGNFEPLVQGEDFRGFESFGGWAVTIRARVTGR